MRLTCVGRPTGTPLILGKDYNGFIVDSILSDPKFFVFADDEKWRYCDCSWFKPADDIEFKTVEKAKGLSINEWVEKSGIEPFKDDILTTVQSLAPILNDEDHHEITRHIMILFRQLIEDAI